MNDKFEQWGIVELFGHQRIAGHISEASIGGCSFVRIDVPGDPGYTKFFGNGAIYGLTITDEPTARAAAKYFAPRPMDEWSAQKMLESPKPKEPPGPGDPGEPEEEL